MFDHYWPASETPFKWRFAGGVMMVRFSDFISSLPPHQLKKEKSVIPFTLLNATE